MNNTQAQTIEDIVLENMARKQLIRLVKELQKEIQVMKKDDLSG